MPGKFSIKFQGAKIWNSLSEETKSLHRLAFTNLKREIIQSYWHTVIIYSFYSQYLIHKYIGNSSTIASHYSFIVNIIVFCTNYY